MRHVLLHPSWDETITQEIIDLVKEKFKDQCELHVMSKLDVLSVATLCGCTYEECWNPNHVYILDQDGWDRLTKKNSFNLKNQNENQEPLKYDLSYLFRL